jgi:predicted O-linked N-acetylglucosamine transferase (SPINDLY family)
MNDTLMRNAMMLHRSGRLAEAADIYAGIIKEQPSHFDALHALGVVKYQGGQLFEAERLIGEALRVRPKAADALYNRACLLQKLNRNEEALACFDEAIAQKPDYAEALTNRGTLLMELSRYEPALSDFEKAAALRPSIPQVWNNLAGALVKLHRNGEALAAADRALKVHPKFPDAWRNRGTALLGERRFAEALQSFEQAIAIEPGNAAAAWAGKGHALNELLRRDEAIASYSRALEISPGQTEILFHRALAHFAGRKYALAAEDCRTVLQSDPYRSGVRGMRLFALMSECNWTGLAHERELALKELREGRPSLAPFECIAVSGEQADAAMAARLSVKEASVRFEPLWRDEIYAHEKIRVAYVSANFHEHAVSRLMAGVWERHDRSRFETIALSLGPDDGSPLRARVVRSFDRFIDMSGQSDADAAGVLRALEADIALDLMGYKEGCRPGIFARRPAPVQVNYLGFPGTTASPHMDYILADRMVIPDEDAGHFSECIVTLPGCYLPNDRERVIGKVPSRAEAGLPYQGFVFASFNASYKYTPEVFTVWMRLLKRVPESILWLGQVNPAAARNLRMEAAARGIDAERLVFAPFTARQEDHLARLSLADLVLDTLPYNSHATACDALWAGVPVVTCMGRAFAGRVGASALYAAGLPELAAETLSQFEVLALRLASDPKEHSAVKEKLGRLRLHCSLFDTERFTRDLESAFVTMCARQRRGEKPLAFSIEENS